MSIDKAFWESVPPLDSHYYLDNIEAGDPVGDSGKAREMSRRRYWPRLFTLRWKGLSQPANWMSGTICWGNGPTMTIVHSLRLKFYSFGIRL